MRGEFSSHCHATKKNGNPCRFAVAPGVDFCPNHQPGVTPADLSAAAKHARSAASESAQAQHQRPDPPQLLEAVLSFSDRESLQAVLDTIVRLTLSGHIDTTRAGIAIRACSIAARNFNPIIETLEGPQPPSYNRLAYYHRVQSLLLSIDPLLQPPHPDG